MKADSMAAFSPDIKRLADGPAIALLELVQSLRLDFRTP